MRQSVEGAPWQTIAEQPWIIPPPISTHHALAASLFATRGGAPAKLVEADNEAGLALYRGLGFSELYSYHYRQPAGPVS